MLLSIISIIIGITITNSMVLIMTRPVANGKSAFDSLATIGNTAITGPADCRYPGSRTDSGRHAVVR